MSSGDKQKSQLYSLLKNLKYLWVILETQSEFEFLGFYGVSSKSRLSKPNSSFILFPIEIFSFLFDINSATPAKISG